MRHIGNGKTRDRDHADEFVRTMIKHQTSRGWMRFAVEHSQSGEFMGFAGFDDKNGLLDFGWRLGQAFWGGGYGFEASAAALWVGQKTFSLEKITAQSYPENVGSIRLMKKMGMSQIGASEAFGRPLVVYGFSAEWPDGFPGLFHRRCL